MVAFFSLFFPVLTVIWTRKNDIANTIQDGDGRKYIYDKINKENTEYRDILGKTLKLLDEHVENGWNSYFSLGFLTLFYNTISFSIAWIISGGDIQGFGNVVISPDKSWLIDFSFLAGVIAFPTCYILARNGWAVEESFSNLIKKVLIFPYPQSLVRGGLAVLGSASIFYATSSVYLSISVFMFAFIQIFSIGKLLSEEELLSKNVMRVGIAASFGPTALLAVVFSLIVGKDGSEIELVIPIIVIVASMLSGIFGFIGAKISKGDLDEAPVYTRAAISMGVYISNHFCGFILAVSIAAVVPTVVNSLFSNPYSVSLAILLTSAIFLAGTRTLAGAGLVVFVVILFTSTTLYFISIDNFFSTWSTSLVFWAILPFTNSIFDWISWSISRYFAGKIASKRDTLAALWLCLDVVAAYVITTSLVVALVFALHFYQIAALQFIGSIPFDLQNILESVSKRPFTDGLWVVLLLASGLIPTLGHFLILTVGGVSNAFPQSWKKSVSEQLLREDFPKHSIEALAWKLALFDRVSGIVIVTAAMICAFYFASGFANSVGQSLLYFAKISLHWFNYLH